VKHCGKSRAVKCKSTWETTQVLAHEAQRLLKDGKHGFRLRCIEASAGEIRDTVSLVRHLCLGVSNALLRHLKQQFTGASWVWSCTGRRAS
jgi:hypothetical protein